MPPNDNVWVDIATLWRQLLTTPDQAAHALGKLLSRVGAQRVMWGTDAIWYGSPEPQIMAMRTFEITPQFQETYQYPALTPEVKAGLFGLNAAKLFGVDPTAMRCGLTQDPLTANISEAAALPRRGRAALGVESPRADDTPPDAGLAGLVRHELGAVLEPGRKRRGHARARHRRFDLRPSPRWGRRADRARARFG